MLIVIQFFCLSCVLFGSNVFCNKDEVLTKGKLIFSTVVFRHGDRMPIKPYANDPHRNVSEWPEQWGQLSNLGKQQQYVLGKWLRQRYNGTLISEQYSDKEIYVQSSDVDRTLMSAAVNMAGLYPPRNDQLWNVALEWQPVPVHTIPEELDTLILTSKPCPLYDFYFAALMKTEQMQMIKKKFSSLIEYLSKHSGNDLSLDAWSITNLYDTLMIQQKYNKTLPDWTHKVFPHGDFEYLSNLSFAYETFTPQMARLKYGVLLKEILVRFQKKIRSELVPDRSVWIYSGHDTTISGLLNTMGMFKLHAPTYVSAILFELRTYDNESYVSIFYKDSAVTPEPMFIPGCGTSCPLEKLFKMFEKSMPSRDRDDECKLFSSLAVEITTDKVPTNTENISTVSHGSSNTSNFSILSTMMGCMLWFFSSYLLFI